MSRSELNWQMTGLFLLALAVLIFVMKLVTLLLSPAANRNWSWRFWLQPSPNSLERLSPANRPTRILFRTLWWLTLLVLSYWLYGKLVTVVPGHTLLLNYAALPILLSMSEFLATSQTLIWLPGGQLLPPVHNRPWLAHSLAEFWGQRWNLWFSDWFRSVILARLRRRPLLALILIFAISGVMHEWVINVPLYFLTGSVMFGSMMAYFLLQAIGILLERRFLRGYDRLRIAFAWLLVIVPAPLIMNEGLLRTLQLWPEPVSVSITRRVALAPGGCDLCGHFFGINPQRLYPAPQVIMATER